MDLLHTGSGDMGWCELSRTLMALSQILRSCPSLGQSQNGTGCFVQSLPVAAPLNPEGEAGCFPYCFTSAGRVRAGPAFHHQICLLARKEKGTHHSPNLEEALLFFQTPLYLGDLNTDKAQEPQTPW